MPRISKLQPGHCDSCATLIEGAVVSFNCRIHRVCFPCSQTMPGLISGWKNKAEACQYCQLEGAAYIEQTEFKQPYPKTTPKSTTHIAQIDLPDGPWCGWPTLYDDVIAVGRRMSSTIDIVNVNGQIVSHKYPVGTWATGGLYLDTERCVISVFNPVIVFTCNIYPKEASSTSPQILTTLSVLSPINVFPMQKFRYGIFCLNPTRIDIFSKRAIYTEKNSKPLMSLAIDYKWPENKDCACCTPEGDICVSGMATNKVYIYDSTGVLLQFVGKIGTYEDTIPGELWYPTTIVANDDGTIVITGSYGEIQTYRQNIGWKIVKTRGNHVVCASVLSDTKVWLIMHINKSVEVFNVHS